MRHPWELTLREFIEKVERDYGIVITEPTAVLSLGRLLRKGGVLYSVPELEDDTVLRPDVLRSLCRRLRLPPEDFGLDPEIDD